MKLNNFDSLYTSAISDLFAVFFEIVHLSLNMQPDNYPYLLKNKNFGSIVQFETFQLP